MQSRRPGDGLGNWIGLVMALMLAAALLMAISACAPTVGIARPAVTLPSAYSVVPAGSAPLDRWWRRLDDPQLARLVERGLAAGADVRLAVARLAEAQAIRGGALARFGLQGDLRASAGVQRTARIGGDTSGFVTGGAGDPSSGGAVAALAGTRADTVAASVPMSWELDLVGRREVIRRGADADLAAVRFAYEGSRAKLAADIADSLFVARGMVARIAESTEAIAELRSARRVLAIGVARGLTSSAGLDRLDNEIARVDADRIAVEADLSLAKRSLLVLTGDGDADPGTLVITSRQGLPPDPPATLPGDLLRRRPDIREAAARLDRAMAQVQLQRLELFPQVTLQPGIGLIAARGTFDYGLGLWTLAAGLTVPMFDRPRLLAMLGAEQGRARQAVISYERAVQQGFAEADGALVRLAADRTRLAILDGAVSRADAIVDAARLGLARGLFDAATLLDAQRERRAARGARAEVRIDLARRTITAFRALGGGWTPGEGPAS